MKQPIPSFAHRLTCSGVLALAVVLLLGTGARAEMITVLNRSFETPLLARPGNSSLGMPNWQRVPGGGNWGVYRPLPSDFNVPVPLGLQVAYANEGGGIFQVLSAL